MAQLGAWENHGRRDFFSHLIPSTTREVRPWEIRRRVFYISLLFITPFLGVYEKTFSYLSHPHFFAETPSRATV